MSNQISTFNFKSQPVRIQSLNDEPYFCLTDVCLVLGVNRRSSEAFRLNEKGCNKIAVLTEGGMQEVVFINEPNLYRIIFRSNKSQAIDFQNWVFEEVLPQIRKTGQYSQNSTQIVPLEPKPDVVLPHEKAEQIAKYLVRARAFAKEVEVFHRKLYEDLGIPRYVRNDIAGKAYDIAHEFNVWLDPFIEQALPQLNQQRLARF
ncbi:BRO-N domain-containing protein [Glaesserella parasuis]|uniref:BRO-N domain-containing protein n=1 Tax=Glaesserella parasuis TaxID=738 RepID=UPI0021C14470|nr:BRO family protein [Glaesserella parasuis]MDG6366554.1 BRO family protein [Glaesserella parasuis]MDG6372920.1 BRO family protein [Glaesserella parasuis]MDG6429495.1 BRO family protein [Glaesserella parasuis]MDG6444852.1 BRO family protein [Glaesserella parasuis]MDG6829070.1 BRO family protein [Glaesserella parasuis]